MAKSLRKRRSQNERNVKQESATVEAHAFVNAWIRARKMEIRGGDGQGVETGQSRLCTIVLSDHPAYYVWTYGSDLPADYVWTYGSGWHTYSSYL